jgi:hypothetical protein
MSKEKRGTQAWEGEKWRVRKKDRYLFVSIESMQGCAGFITPFLFLFFFFFVFVQKVDPLGESHFLLGFALCPRLDDSTKERREERRY